MTKNKSDNIKLGAIIILIISAIVFVFFGVGTEFFSGLFNGGKNNVFGSYNNKKIIYAPGTEMQKQVAGWSRYAEYYRDPNMSPEELQFNVWQAAFNTTLRNMVISESVEKTGYKVPSTVMDREIYNEFLDENKKFNKALYNQATSEEINALKQEIKRRNIYNIFQSDLLGSDKKVGQSNLYGLKIAGNESSFMQSIQKDQKAFTAAIFSTSDYPMEEAVNYGKNNADTFKRYDLSALTYPDEKSAEKALKNLQSEKKTFEDENEFVGKYLTNSDGKIFNNFRFQIQQSLEDKEDITKIITLTQGSYSPVIKTKSSGVTVYTIFRCDGNAIEANMDDEEMQNTVLNYLTQYERSVVENYFIEKAREFCTDAATTSFKKAAPKHNAELTEKTALFPFNYGNVDFMEQVPFLKTESDSTGLDLANDLNGLTIAFSLAEGQISEPFLLQNKVVVLKCEEVKNDINVNQSHYADKNAVLGPAEKNTFEKVFLNNDKVVDNFQDTYFNMIIDNR